jgi:hypothetical protein
MDLVIWQKELIKLLLFEEDRPAEVRVMLARPGDGISGVSGRRGASPR